MSEKNDNNKDSLNEILDKLNNIDKSCNEIYGKVQKSDKPYRKNKWIGAYIITALFPLILILLSSVFIFCTCKHLCPPDTVRGCMCKQDKQESTVIKDTKVCSNKNCWQITICPCEQSFEKKKDTIRTDSLQINLDVHLDVKSQTGKSDWPMLVCRLIIVTLLIAACVIMFIRFLKHLDKLVEQDAKHIERLTDETIRIYNEEKEHERLAERTRVGLLEKQGKTIIDEETRAKEHQRKLEVMDKERIADLSDKVLDIAKVQVSNKTLDEKRAQQWISELIHMISNLSSKK